MIKKACYNVPKKLKIRQVCSKSLMYYCKVGNIRWGFIFAIFTIC